MRRVVHLYRAPLMGFLVAHTGRFELAEDIAQDVFLLSYQKRHTIREPRQLRAWLYAAARRHVWNAMNKKSFHSEISISEEDGADHMQVSLPETQTKRLLSEETRRLLLAAIHVLNDRERDVVTLRFFGHLAIREIAEAAGIPEGSVGVTMSRGLKKIREQLEKQGLSLGDLLP